MNIPKVFIVFLILLLGVGFVSASDDIGDFNGTDFLSSDGASLDEDILSVDSPSLDEDVLNADSAGVDDAVLGVDSASLDEDILSVDSAGVDDAVLGIADNVSPGLGDGEPDVPNVDWNAYLEEYYSYLDEYYYSLDDYDEDNYLDYY